MRENSCCAVKRTIASGATTWIVSKAMRYILHKGQSYIENSGVRHLDGCEGAGGGCCG